MLDHRFLHVVKHVNVFERVFVWLLTCEVLAQSSRLVQRDELLLFHHNQIGDNARLL